MARKQKHTSFCCFFYYSEGEFMHHCFQVLCSDALNSFTLQNKQPFQDGQIRTPPSKLVFQDSKSIPGLTISILCWLYNYSRLKHYEQKLIHRGGTVPQKDLFSNPEFNRCSRFIDKRCRFGTILRDIVDISAHVKGS